MCKPAHRCASLHRSVQACTYPQIIHILGGVHRRTLSAEQVSVGHRLSSTTCPVNSEKSGGLSLSIPPVARLTSQRQHRGSMPSSVLLTKSRHSGKTDSRKRWYGCKRKKNVNGNRTETEFAKLTFYLHAGLKSCNLATLQVINIEILQSCNPAILQVINMLSTIF